MPGIQARKEQVEGEGVKRRREAPNPADVGAGEG